MEKVVELIKDIDPKMAIELWTIICQTSDIREAVQMNSKLATILQDYEHFKGHASANDNIPVDQSHLPYLFGKIAGVKLYCDPILKWSDTQFTIDPKPITVKIKLVDDEMERRKS